MKKYKKALTYGTFDLFHFGHINILYNISQLAEEIVVGLSTDEFNLKKNKKAYHSYEERKRNLEQIKIIDKIIPENHWEQKIEDIQNYHCDVFFMGDDWKGKFDFLKEYCEVIYLPRTKSVSSSLFKEFLGIESVNKQIDKNEN